MREKIRVRCELLKKNSKAIANEFSFENTLMSVVAGMIFTGAEKEADVERNAKRYLQDIQVFFRDSGSMLILCWKAGWHCPRILKSILKL